MSGHEDDSEMESMVPESHRFEDEDAAMEKAEEIGLDGVHEMEFDGETMYVPGGDHDAYVNAVEDMAAGVLDAVSVYQG